MEKVAAGAKAAIVMVRGGMRNLVVMMMVMTMIMTMVVIIVIMKVSILTKS